MTRHGPGPAIVPSSTQLWLLAAAVFVACSGGGPLSARSAKLEPLPHDSALQAVDSIAAAFLAESGVVGFTVAVLHGNEVVFDRGYGWADLEHAVSARPETVYRIGSLTKTMTAVAVLQLAEQGLLELTDSVGRFLPDYPAPGRAVTVHHLLSMTSGIPNYTMDPGLDYFRDRLAHDSVVALFRGRPLLFPPGARYDYSNSNYYLLGLIIEMLAGTSYEEYVQQRVIDPVGSGGMRYCPNAPLIPARAAGYRIENGQPVNARPISVAWAYAAGGFCSTASDQVRWIRALNEGVLIRPASFERMATRTVLNGGVESGYGYGVAVDELRGHRQLSHAGNLDGFQASISYFPDDSLAIVVLTNTESSGAAMLKERIARRILGIRELTATDFPDLPLEAAERSRYVGTYLLESVGVRLTVSERNGGLQVSIAGQAPLRLLNQGEHRFVIEEDPESTLEFTIEGGIATRVRVRSATGNVMPGVRVRS